MKKTKICTVTFHIQSGEDNIPFDTLSRKDQQIIQEAFSLGCMDLYMQQLGYRRVDAKQSKGKGVSI